VTGVRARTRSRSRARSAQFGAVLALVSIMLAIAVIARAETETTPVLILTRSLSRYVAIPGQRPSLQWPSAGQSAVDVEGIGSLGSRGQQLPVPIASVAKVMTAYLTLRAYPLAPSSQGFTMRVSAANVHEDEQREALGESIVKVRAGERLTERKALEALMLPSANNIAALLAVHDAGSVQAFVQSMNRAARELAMRATTYTDPSGFEDTTVSTAADQLKLARAAMANPMFAQIVALPSATLPVAGRVQNFNALVGSEGYIGVKTGSDNAAGGCLMFAKRFEVAGQRLTVLGVVLGQREGPLIEAALLSARRLGNSAAAVVGVHTVLAAGTRVLSIDSKDGSKVAGATSAPLVAIGWPGLGVQVQVSDEHVGRNVARGQQVATIALDGGADYRLRSSSAPITADGSLGAPSLVWRVLHIFD
jgi:D-alanyl-D-alanine carboxypeptidase (penicillin-binding protein 5/6)